jgi:hypothetical protein
MRRKPRCSWPVRTIRYARAVVRISCASRESAEASWPAASRPAEPIFFQAGQRVRQAHPIAQRTLLHDVHHLVFVVLLGKVLELEFEEGQATCRAVSESVVAKYDRHGIFEDLHLLVWSCAEC